MFRGEKMKKYITNYSDYLKTTKKREREAVDRVMEEARKKIMLKGGN